MDILVYTILQITVSVAITLWVSIPTAIMVQGWLLKRHYGVPWAETLAIAKRFLKEPL
jgi:hypothetical protein